MVINRVLSRTHFERKIGTKTGEWQWYWRTEAANQEPIGVGGEGYDQLSSAVNGFLSQQGYPDWKPSQTELPVDYRMHKFDDSHHVITRYKTGEE